MDRLTELIEKDLISTQNSDEIKNTMDFKLQYLMVELLLDIREELRHIKKSQGDIKWSSKL